MTLKIENDAILAWVQLHYSHRLLLEKVEKALKSSGLPPLAWYDVLLELSRDKSAGLRQYEIGEKILLGKHNLSRLLDRLEKNNYISRHECVEDGRGNTIKITTEGLKIMKKMWPIYGMSIQEHFGVKFDSSELTVLSSLLKKITITNEIT